MSTAVVVTKVDPQTKREAQETARRLGMPLSVVIKIFLKQFIRTKSVSFNTEGEIPSPYLIRAIKQAEKNLKESKHSPVFKTGKEAVAWLEKQGI